MKRLTALSAMVALFILGCGGSNGGGTTAATQTLSGVAAAGAPISGMVSVKGAEGRTATATIDHDGRYSIDVASITAPYILCAEGSVNGENIKIFSIAINVGTINITPITNFIVCSALKASAEAAYDNWEAEQVGSSLLSATETEVQQLLSPALTAAGVDSDFDLLTTKFSADNTGIDAVLSILKISYIGDIATIDNILTGSSFTDDITQSGDSEGLPETDSKAPPTALTDLEIIAAGWQELAEMLTVTPYPDSEAWTGWINAHVADDFLDGGNTKADVLDDFINNNIPFSSFEVAIVEPMDVSDINYSKGYWIKISAAGTNFLTTLNQGMVYDGINWRYYGNQQIFNIEFKPLALMSVDTSGNHTFVTGFDLGVNDDDYHAYDQGVRSALVTGPGLPEEGVLLEHRYPEVKIDIYQRNGSFYQIDDDELIAGMPDNVEYTYTFCSEAAIDLDTDGHQACTVLDTYTAIAKKPLTNSALNASRFAALTSPSSHDLSDLTFGGPMNVSWSNPAGTQTFIVILDWSSSGDNINVNGNIATGALDTTGLPLPDGGWATIGVGVVDSHDRYLLTLWEFATQTLLK